MIINSSNSTSDAVSRTVTPSLSSNPKVSFTSSPFQGTTTTSSLSYKPQTFQINSLSDFTKTVKASPLNVQLETLASSMSTIGATISNLSDFYNKNSVSTTQLLESINQVSNAIQVILPYANDEQINTIQMQLEQQKSQNQFNLFTQNPKQQLPSTTFETSLLYHNKPIDWTGVAESAGGLYGGGQKLQQYINMLQSESDLVGFGEELMTQSESYGSLVSETLGLGIEEGTVLSTFGIEGAMSAAGVGALEVGTLAAGGLVGVAALAILGSAYGLYKAFGGSEDLGDLWNDTSKFFGGLFSP